MEDPEVQSKIPEDGVEWIFIPPGAPHFGGLWEAGVKSVKSHMKRMCGNLTSTYEELHILLTQISAILNSRPLTQMCDRPDDYEAITPGHFLTGCQLKALPT